MDAWMENFARSNILRSSEIAHDLKNPLNVAMLNLELLKMSLADAADAEDETIDSRAKAIALELRRMALIFDAFFTLSTPPSAEGGPTPLDLSVICTDAASEAGYELQLTRPVILRAHESRIRMALHLFFEGASHTLGEEGRRICGESSGPFALSVAGRPRAADLDITKIFKFYYSDLEGNPDLSLASARLIAETYGGGLTASQIRDEVTLRMTFPTGGE